MRTVTSIAAAVACIAIASLAAPSPPDAKSPSTSLTAAVTAHGGLVDAATVVPELQVDLRYASDDNVLGRAVYGDLRQCFLHKKAADMLAEAQKALMRMRPGWRLRVFDCVRPMSVQRQMWQMVQGTEKEPYVANPKRISSHSFGCAVDLSIADAQGQLLDMGTPFDFFGPLARPDRELTYLRKGQLTPEQIANRLVLREIMLRAGFHVLPLEWWHFDCAPRRQIQRHYRPVP